MGFRNPLRETQNKELLIMTVAETLKTINAALHVTESGTLLSEQTTAEVAEAWMRCKDAETAAKDFKTTREIAGKILNDRLGDGDKVLINKGGYAQVEFKVTPKPSTSYKNVVDSLKARHPELVGEIDNLLKANASSSESYSLKRTKS
jgi:hypothetical protein